jgi:hypothetical protein
VFDMNKLTAERVPGGGQNAGAADAGAAVEASASRMMVRVRLLMLVSGLTTLIAIAAVVGVIGYRVYHTGQNPPLAHADGVILLPKGARVTGATVAGDRVAVTLDIGGATEIRTYDISTLKEAGRLRFATEP